MYVHVLKTEHSFYVLPEEYAYILLTVICLNCQHDTVKLEYYVIESELY
jgi:hypothetical protein